MNKVISFSLINFNVQVMYLYYVQMTQTIQMTLYKYRIINTQTSIGNGLCDLTRKKTKYKLDIDNLANAIHK